MISNRATLLALHALSARERPADAEAAGAAPGAGTAEELKALVRDVREAGDRVDALTREIEREAAAARDRMSSVRAEVAAVLETAAAEATAEETPPAPGANRVMEQMREMIRDAAAKGERLSAAGERASRAAEALKHRVEGELEGVERLIVLLGGSPSTRRGSGEAASAPGARFKVLERDHEPGAAPRREDAGGEERA